MTRKFGKHLRVTYRKLNSCSDIIGSHQQYIPVTSGGTSFQVGVMLPHKLNLMGWR